MDETICGWSKEEGHTQVDSPNFLLHFHYNHNCMVSPPLDKELDVIATRMDQCHMYWGSGPLHTWNWEPMTVAFQALSLVEKAEPVVQVRFTLCSRDQWSTWMQDGCKVYKDSYLATRMDHVSWPLGLNSKNPLLEVGPTQNWRSWHSKHSQSLVYSILSCVKSLMNKNSLK